MNRTLALLLAGLLAASSLHAEQDSREASRQEKEFVVSYSPRPLTLDPLHIYTTMESELSTALYEGLVGYHPLTLQPVPGVAERWQVSPDKRVYRFFLRDNALYSNGDPVRAQDFRDSWMRVLDPQAHAEYSFLFDVIKGAREYRNGNKEAEVGIRVISDKELEVELVKPASHFLKLLTHLSFVPIHPRYYGKEGWDQASSIVGNGPFYLVERTPQELVLTKNRLYWDAANVKLDTLRVRLIDDPAKVSELFDQGQIDWANNWDTAALKDRSKIVFNPMFATDYFYFVCAQKPWSDARVRRALALLLPWDEIRSQDNTLFPTSRLIPPIPSYPEVKGITAPDEQQAMSLLEEAGYPQGRGLPELTIKIPDDPESQRIAALAAGRWKEKLGLSVAVRSYPYDRYLREVKSPEYTLGTVIWIGDYADPLTFLQMWTTGANLNDAHFSDPEFDRLVDSSLSEDGEKRYKLLGEAETILLHGAVVLPISHTPAFNLIDLERVEGWFPNVLNVHPFKYLGFRVPRIPPGVASLPRRGGGP